VSSVNLLWAIAAAVGGAYVVGVALVHLAHRWGHFMLDHPGTVQKFHVQPVPRVGGMALFAACVAAWWLVPEGDARRILGTVLVAGLLALGIGLAEDLTKRVGVLPRLLITISSGIVASLWTGIALNRTGVPMADTLLAFWPLAVLFTGFAAGGIANAINIIDGFNGLASMCCVLILLCLAYVGFQVDDLMVTWLALAGAGALLGFFVWNFPAGLIFLGDGGAYFMGFYLAEVAILLLVRNPTVSPMFPLLLCIYPVFETVFSIYRRRFLRAMPPSMPDGIHLHSLIYRRVMRWAVGNRSAKALTRRNSMTSPYLWLLCMCAAIPSVLFWDNTAVLAALILLFGVSYVALYWRIVRFRAPRWMVFRR